MPTNEHLITLKKEIKVLLIEALALEDIQPEDITDDMLLFSDTGLGLDSIDALELGIALRKKYSVQIDANDKNNRAHFQSIENLAQFVLNNLQAHS